MFSILGLILSLILIMHLAYKGYSTIITAPIIAMITIILTTGFDAHLMANYTEVYMSGFANFIKNYFPLFMTGAVFAKLMEEVGYAKSIAHFITKKLGKDKSVLAVVLSGAILTYGGVSLFVVAFILYPIASMLFKEADIPKRLIPGTIALGAFTFTMTALPGSPEIQNVIPMKYFGTDTFAAPVIGIFASIMMLSLGMIWLTKRVKSAKANNEGYGNHSDNIAEENYENLPSIFKAMLPIMIIFIINLFFSKVYYENIDGSYLSKFNTTLSNVSGTWSVIIAIVLSDIFILLTNFKKIKNIKSVLDIGVTNSFKPLLNSSAIVGYGSVIKSLAIFSVIQSFIFGISSNPIISEALSVNLICGLTASASGGLEISLNALAPTYLQISHALNIPPEILHRIASLSSGGLDTLPHNGAVITTLAICGLTHKEAYTDMFVTSVVIPIFVTTIVVILTSIRFGV
ncbi:MAG: GntP family permease [Paeniclostridium sordellii]|uniref:GntP family permease n=1 Tax=Paeniclostridium hominis TaxID=2764329 RepID=A0ABR7JZL1_9FIRM|nr:MULTISPECIES: GntP family permease [Paeniclostridium]MBC6002302.1 GntP family permease [Paeniclostridium hominis]MDU2591332.1 GntP family permease [Paeniclostridium sordellii]